MIKDYYIEGEVQFSHAQIGITRLSQSSNSVDDFNATIDHLKATTLGSYLCNHGIIKLPEKSSFWNTKIEPSVLNFSVFVHEYLHFVHNFSTGAGLNEFIIQLRLARLYCCTVGAAGRSHGTNVLDGVAATEAGRLAKWMQHLRGAIVFQKTSSANGHSPYLSYLRTETTVKIGPQSIKCHGAVVEFGTKQCVELKISLGSTVLMETCAVEAQCTIFDKSDVSGAQTIDFRKSVPPYPYLTGRAIFEGIAEFSPSSEFLCQLCILALQSTDPGETFIELAELCRKSGPHANQKDLVATFVSRSKSYFEYAIPKILKDVLELDIAPFSDRGISGRGLSRMAAWANILFQERLRNVFFELDAIATLPNLGPFIALLKMLPVCPIFLEVDSVSKESEYTFFSEEEPPPEVANELGVFALIEY